MIFFCRFVFPLVFAVSSFSPSLLSWNGRTILASRFLHVYAAHGIDETNMELMLRNYPYFLLLFLTGFYF